MTRPTPVLGAIAVVQHRNRVVLVQRGKAPSKGMWGFPGGHVELGETALEAAERELSEETGLQAKPLRYLTNIDVIARDETGAVTRHYLLAVVLCAYSGGDPVAGDDAADARWVAIDELRDGVLPVLPQVAEVADMVRERRLNAR